MDGHNPLPKLDMSSILNIHYRPSALSAKRICRAARASARLSAPPSSITRHRGAVAHGAKSEMCLSMREFVISSRAAT